MKNYLFESFKNMFPCDSELANCRYFSPDKKFMKDGYSGIEVQNLNVYIRDNQILKNIDLSIPDKKITCIIGPSGCGKSTLLRTFNRLTDDVEGVKGVERF